MRQMMTITTTKLRAYFWNKRGNPFLSHRFSSDRATIFSVYLFLKAAQRTPIKANFFTCTRFYARVSFVFQFIFVLRRRLLGKDRRKLRENSTSPTAFSSGAEKTLYSEFPCSRLNCALNNSCESLSFRKLRLWIKWNEKKYGIIKLSDKETWN